MTLTERFADYAVNYDGEPWIKKESAELEVFNTVSNYVIIYIISIDCYNC